MANKYLSGEQIFNNLIKRVECDIRFQQKDSSSLNNVKIKFVLGESRSFTTSDFHHFSIKIIEELRFLILRQSCTV